MLLKAYTAKKAFRAYVEGGGGMDRKEISRFLKKTDNSADLRDIMVGTYADHFFDHFAKPLNTHHSYAYLYLISFYKKLEYPHSLKSFSGVSYLW